ncbi:hypothetical protein KDA_76180 [Dictyobacter alpinus]|uniref:Carrier domain-containing protein n=1 Tax=Dictyobacter alpinus TaxID=2014873 RepID=A0A402BLB0_9CHLR|nr:cytochrome P450 [Dictyobacter alpinus]GCE32134.1 hypothetical protein KDA_76180 [Dictyobacter alpinus]
MPAKLPATHDEIPSIRQIVEPSVIANPYALYASLSEQGPLYWDQEAKVWVCTGYEEAETILRDPQVRFGMRRLRSNEQLRERGLEKLIPLYTLLRPQMAFLDDPQHRQLRAAIQWRFTAAALDRLHEAIQALVNERLSPFVGKPHRGQMDLIDDFAGPLPTQVAALFLGLPQSDVAYFMRWSAAYERATARYTGPVQLRFPREQEGDLETLEEAPAYFRQVARARLGKPQDDPISDMLRSLIDGAFSADEREEYLSVVVANCLLLLASGYATTTNLIVQSLLWLWKEPDQRRLLEEDPSLLEALINETTRLSSSSQYVVRQALHDTVIGTKRIRRGQTIVILLALANRDERAFPHAQRFLLKRDGKRKQLGFGLGRHFCIGAPYAELLARLAILTFLQRFPGFQPNAPEDEFEWKGPPNSRCPRHVPILLGASLTEHALAVPGRNVVVPTATCPYVKAREIGGQEGAEHWKNAVLSVMASDDGTTTIHFDPNSVKVSLDLQHGIIRFLSQADRVAEPPATSGSTVHTDALASEALQPREIKDRLSHLFATVLALPAEVDDECDFFEAGGDSLALASLLLAIEQHLQVEIDPETIYDHPVLSDLAAVIVKQQKQVRTGVSKREEVYS